MNILSNPEPNASQSPVLTSKKFSQGKASLGLKLRESLNEIPEHWALTPVKDKSPLRDGWQTEKPLSRDALVAELNSGRWTGYGLRLGDVSGGLLALDIDGPDPATVMQLLEEHYGTLPQTVAWSSGKQDRSQRLFQIPEKYQAELKGRGNKKFFDVTQEGEGIVPVFHGAGDAIELRYNGCQSVLPPSRHPETGGYSWLPGCSPSEIGVAEAPHWLVEIFRAAHELNKPAEKKPPVKVIREPLLTSAKTGSRQGWSDEEKARYSLGYLGATYYDDYDHWLKVGMALQAVSDNLLADWERWSFQSSKFKSGDCEKKWRSFTPAKGIGLGTLVEWSKREGMEIPRGWGGGSHQSASSRGKGGGKVVPINREQSARNIETDLEKIVNNHLSKKERESRLASLAKEYGYSIQSVRGIYGEVAKEIESRADRDDVRQELVELLNSQSDGIPLERIFPRELAEPIERFMGWLNLRPESAATALLTGLSSALPSQTKVVINPNLGWTESPGFFGGIVASSTQKKSPIMNTFMVRPLTRLQVESNDRYQEAYSDYQAQCAEYDNLTKKKQTDERDRLYPDGLPAEPKKEVWFYSNVTLEKLKTQMAEQPGKGILLAVDELAGLFGNMNAYRGGKGSDRQDLMSMKDGSPISVGRKTGDVFVEAPLLSVFGTIQPKILQKIQGDGNDSDGLFARFCLVRQPSVPTTLPELDEGGVDLSPLIEGLYRQVASLAPTDYLISREGYALLKKATDDYELQRVAAGDHPIANVYGKNGGRIGELAMLLHVIAHCFKYETPPELITAGTVAAAVQLVGFYTAQQKALYSELDPRPSSVAPHLAKIVDLARKQGALSPRDLQRKLRMKESREEITSYFQELTNMGLGCIQHGRTIKFCLVENSSSDNEVSASVSKVSAGCDTSNPIQDKGLGKVSASVSKKNNFSETNSSFSQNSTTQNGVTVVTVADTSASTPYKPSGSTADTSENVADTLLTVADTSEKSADTSPKSPPNEQQTLFGINDRTMKALRMEPPEVMELLEYRYGENTRECLSIEDLRDWVAYCETIRADLTEAG